MTREDMSFADIKERGPGGLCVSYWMTPGCYDMRCPVRRDRLTSSSSSATRKSRSCVWLITSGTPN